MAYLALWSIASQQAGDEAEEQILIEDLKSQEDPTILPSKVWLEGEWNNDRNDSSSFKLTLGGRKGWRISKHHDWAAQLELPYKRISVGQPGDNSAEDGLADRH